MPDLAREPSMEDILASIKRIIADDEGAASAAAPVTRLRRGPVEVPPPAPHDEEPEEVLELTEPVTPVTPVPPLAAAPEPEPAPRDEAAPASAPVSTILSDHAASASRQSLAALSALVVTPPAAAPAADNTLEALVREMLRPMLKDWLDAKLPELVEGMVAKEIARITGRAL